MSRYLQGCTCPVALHATEVEREEPFSALPQPIALFAECKAAFLALCVTSTLGSTGEDNALALLMLGDVGTPAGTTCAIGNRVLIASCARKGTGR